MTHLNLIQGRSPYIKLFLWHVFIIILSNYAVQIPFEAGPVTTTWGAFTYPFIFITTDLTVRLYGPKEARKVIFLAMIPALIGSYVVGTLFEQGAFRGPGALCDFSLFVFRIALASLSAYIVGQIMDITVFSRLRRLKTWWIAPSCSSVIGNLVDTLVFFAVAFYHSPDPFMAAHWVEIALVDYAVKIMACLMLLVPIYGLLLALIAKFVFKRPLNTLNCA